MNPTISSLILAILSFSLANRSTIGVLRPTLLAILFFLEFILLGFHYFANRLSGVGIDESVVYHLVSRVEGVNYSAFVFDMIYAGVVLVLILIATWVFYKRSIAVCRQQARRFRYLAAFLLLMVSFSVNPAVHDIYQLTIFNGELPEAPKSTKYPEGFEAPLLTVVPKQKKNFVYIYLESLERTYLNNSAFPGLTPNLRRLEQESLSFTNIQQVRGTNWTIAGMVASQCGVPLVIPLALGNSMGGMSSFLPKAICAGDILSEHGYSLNYYGGANLEFAGKGSFYSSHGFEKVVGLQELRPLLKDPAYINGWGLYDDSLLEIVRNEFDALAKLEKPFGMVFLTVDTHHPEGHVSKSCEGVVYGDGKNPILNSVHCADIMIAEVVDHIKKHAAGTDTAIIIASDHLAMPNTASHLLDKYDRQNLLLVLNGDVPPGFNNQRGSTLDIAPTLLNILGFGIDGLGYGKNLLSSHDATIKNVTGYHVDELTKKGRNYIESLWSYPDFRRGFSFDVDDRLINVGGQNIRLPVLLTVSDAGHTKEIFFEFYSPIALSEQVQRLDPNVRFIWIDQCSKTKALSDVQSNIQDELCLVAGVLAGEKLLSRVLNSSINFDFPFSSRDIAEQKHMQNLYQERFDSLRRLNIFGRGDIDEIVVGELVERVGLKNRYVKSINYLSIDNLIAGIWPKNKESMLHGLEGNVGLRVKSVGRPTEASFVEVSHSTRTKSKVEFLRGFTLLGISGSAAPIKLGHVDTCAYGGSIKDQISFTGNFKSLVKDTANLFPIHLIVLHDSAECGNSNFREVLQGLGAEKVDLIGYRTPYFALFFDGKIIYEDVRKSEEEIEVAIFDAPSAKKESRNRWAPLPRVAHAGGGYRDRTYTNSIDALEANKNNYRLFEMDFSWTTDGELVCLHDWDSSLRYWFKLQTPGAMSYSEYFNLVRSNGELQHCDLESLTKWMRENPSARIVTDIKDRNIEGLALISARYPDLQQRFIPQVYQPPEYYRAKMLKFKDIIWTLYEYAGSDVDVINYAAQMDLMGLTMPEFRARRGLAKEIDKLTGIRSWVHTINDEKTFKELQSLGVESIYTDWMPE